MYISLDKEINIYYNVFVSKNTHKIILEGGEKYNYG